MSDPQALSAENVPLVPVRLHSSLEYPELAKILIFMFWYEQAAAADSKILNDQQVRGYNLPAAVVDISKKLFKIEIRARSVEKFYQEAKSLVHSAGKDWGPEAVTQIISSQVTEKQIFDNVNTFLLDHAGDQTLDYSTLWLITIAWQASGDLGGNNMVQTYAEEIKNHQRPFWGIPFPTLEQSFQGEPTALFSEGGSAQWDPNHAPRGSASAY